MTKKTKELSDHIQIDTEGTLRTIKMSFGLLNRICRLVGDVEGSIQLLIDPVLQEAVILEILAERNEEGQIIRKHDVDDYNLSKKDVMVLLEWVAEHLLDFFLSALKIAKSLQDRNQDRIDNLTPPSASSSDGSPT